MTWTPQIRWHLHAILQYRILESVLKKYIEAKMFQNESILFRTGSYSQRRCRESVQRGATDQRTSRHVYNGNHSR